MNTLSPSVDSRIEKSKMGILWIAMASMSMLFAGLSSAYVVRQAEKDWIQTELPQAFYTSTIVIILSSFLMFFATRAIKSGQQSALKMALLGTLVLGCAFTVSQFQGWKELVASGSYLSGGSVSSSFLYVISGVHLAHIAGGLITLLVTLVQAFRKKYSAEQHTGVRLTAAYWHFLDIVWVFLVVFMWYVK